jgi:2-polyprenyl-3-methyl-5-hydroxy-6-metoxy-1,4-benzoquinol methylase
MLCRLCNGRHLNKVLRTETFEIIECTDCKIAFTEPAPSLPDYEKMDFHSGEDLENAERLTRVEELDSDWQVLIKLQAKMIAKHFKKDSKILEIGCGEGILLDELKKLGFVDVAGVEPSRTGAVRAGKRGLKVKNDYFSREVVAEQYDLILMSHVFEHIEKPQDFIEELNAALSAGGALMFTQTNFRGIIPRYLKENWYAWVPDQHFWHFTLEGMRLMFAKRNFRLLDSTYTSLVHPHNWLYRLSNITNSFKDQFIVIFQKYAK